MTETVHILLVKMPNGITPLIVGDPTSAEYHRDDFEMRGYPCTIITVDAQFSEPGARPNLQYRGALGSAHSDPKSEYSRLIQATVWQDLTSMFKGFRRYVFGF